MLIRGFAGVAPGCLLALGAFSFPAGAAGRDSQLAGAIPAIESTIEKSGAEVAVAFRTLDGKSRWLRCADVRQGKARLDEPLSIRNEFHSLVDGSPFALDPQDDSETELYRAAGETRTGSASTTSVRA
jgi:beta-lactamase class A